MVCGLSYLYHLYGDLVFPICFEGKIADLRVPNTDPRHHTWTKSLVFAQAYCEWTLTNVIPWLLLVWQVQATIRCTLLDWSYRQCLVIFSLNYYWQILDFGLFVHMINVVTLEFLTIHVGYAHVVDSMLFDIVSLCYTHICTHISTYVFPWYIHRLGWHITHGCTFWGIW